MKTEVAQERVEKLVQEALDTERTDSFVHLLDDRMSDYAFQNLEVDSNDWRNNIDL